MSWEMAVLLAFHKPGAKKGIPNGYTQNVAILQTYVCGLSLFCLFADLLLDLYPAPHIDDNLRF